MELSRRYGMAKPLSGLWSSWKDCCLNLDNAGLPTALKGKGSTEVVVLKMIVKKVA